MSDQSSLSNSDVTLEGIIKAFLSHHKFLHEYRLQKLVYLLELYHVSKNGEPLNSADFKPFMYGAYSEDVSSTLEELEDEISTKKDIHHGKRTKVYLGHNVDADVSEEISDLIQNICKATNNLSNDDLAKWSKQTQLFETTPYGDTMEIHKYSNQSKQDLKSELIEDFPELFSGGD